MTTATDPAASGPASVTVTDDGPIRVVTIDRPDRRNAVDRPTADLLIDAFAAFDADDALSVAVLTGAGGTFCAGADLKAVGSGRGKARRVGAPRVLVTSIFGALSDA